MRCLAIDCATSACSVALFDGLEIPAPVALERSSVAQSQTTLSAAAVGANSNWTLLADDFRNLGRGHAEQLIPMIEALPDRGRADIVAVALGPGSFTGVRIGIAAARALALSWKASLLGYPTLALVAAQAQHQLGPEPVTVSMTGGHGEWFVQSYDKDGNQDSELLSLSPAEAVNKFTNPVVAGSSALEFGRLRNVKQALDLLPESRSLPLLQIQYFTWVISPIYGREPDARIFGSG